MLDFILTSLLLFYIKTILNFIFLYRINKYFLVFILSAPPFIDSLKSDIFICFNKALSSKIGDGLNLAHELFIKP